MSGNTNTPDNLAALMEQSRAIIEAKSHGESIVMKRPIPRYMPDGEEIKSIQDLAVMMETDPASACLYVQESKQIPEDHPLKLEAKKLVVRHVRTPGGVRRYGQPIGTRIIVDTDTGEIVRNVARAAKPDRKRPKRDQNNDKPVKKRSNISDPNGGQYNSIKSKAIDSIMAARRKRAVGTGKGTLDDPINVGGNAQLAAKHLAEGKHIRMNKVHDVGTLLDELNKIVAEAKEKGDDAPNYDLCKVSVPKTNLFCAESKGIPRAKMPQLGGKPRDGSRADALPRNDKGEVNIEEHFRKELRARGIDIEPKKVKASFLKASQEELDGPKVAGMSRAMEQGKVPDAPIFVTRDGYIIDGHHRWASKVAIDAKDGSLGDIEMPVEMLDMEIGEALDFANQFALDFGIMPKGLGAAAEGVKALRALFGVDGGMETKIISLSVPVRRSFGTPPEQDGWEEKVVRRVKTPAGAKRFGQPINSIIVRDGLNLGKLKHVGKNDTWDIVEGSDGKRYDVGYDENNKVWVATAENDWDNIVVDNAASEDEVFELLNQAIGTRATQKRGRSLGPGDLKPADVDAPKATATKINVDDMVFDSSGRRGRVVKINDDGTADVKFVSAQPSRGRGQQFTIKKRKLDSLKPVAKTSAKRPVASNGRVPVTKTPNTPAARPVQKTGTFKTGDKLVIGNSRNQSYNGRPVEVVKDDGGRYVQVRFTTGGGRGSRGQFAGILPEGGLRELRVDRNVLFKPGERPEEPAALTRAQFSVGDEVQFQDRYGQTLTGKVTQRRANGNVVIHAGNMRYTRQPGNVSKVVGGAGPKAGSGEPEWFASVDPKRQGVFKAGDHKRVLRGTLPGEKMRVVLKDGTVIDGTFKDDRDFWGADSNYSIAVTPDGASRAKWVKVSDIDKAWFDGGPSMGDLVSEYVETVDEDEARLGSFVPGVQGEVRTPSVRRVTAGDKVTLGQARRGSLVYDVVSVNGNNATIADSSGTTRSVKLDRLNKVGGSTPAPATPAVTQKAGPFKKSDRVVVTGMTGDLAQHNGKKGVVQQSRAGGATAVVKLDDGMRVSIRQSNLAADADRLRESTPAENYVKLTEDQLNGLLQRRSLKASNRKLIEAELARRKTAAPNRKSADSIAKYGVRMGQPVDAFRFTTEQRKRLEDEYNRWVEAATVDELKELRDELRKLSRSGAITTRDKGSATAAAGRVERIIADRLNKQ